MGHVDHGKTTLLDYIRKTTLAAREAGGITQAIGAYEIEHNGKGITFIDTPGHEAFSNMRTYGANIADLAILVVAADDGVKPQTKEALDTILKTKTPFVVAINKIDKNNADIEGTKKSLLQNGVFLEGYGGNTSYQLVSAKTGEGVNELLDLVLLATEMENLEADEKVTSGVITTSRRDPRKGILVGVILKNGTLKVGQFIGTASAQGKIKSLEDFTGKKVSELPPSSPALIFGLEAIPNVGEEFLAGDSAAVAEFSKKKLTEFKELAVDAVAVQEAGEAINIVLKADETASLEALKGLVSRIPLGFPVKIVNESVGDLTENDVKFAINTGAIIVGFRMKIDKAASNLASTQKVMVLESPIIYELENSLKAYAKKILPKEVRRLEVLAVFGDSKGKERVVGGKVILGPIKNQEPFEIWQDKKLIGRGKMKNLQSQRKDIPQAETGMEAGLLVESDEPIKIGQQLLFVDSE
ncbi:MAG: translation initiation factor IF-2 [Minisyncoccia bacterium]|jgi:translation initiation factor IF-2